MIVVPIDALAGHVDESALGGNSTKAAGALLTDQQAFDIKKVVQNAIEQAFVIMASSQVDAGANGQAEVGVWHPMVLQRMLTSGPSRRLPIRRTLTLMPRSRPVRSSL